MHKKEIIFSLFLFWRNVRRYILQQNALQLCDAQDMRLCWISDFSQDGAVPLWAFDLRRYLDTKHLYYWTGRVPDSIAVKVTKLDFFGFLFESYVTRYSFKVKYNLYLIWKKIVNSDRGRKCWKYRKWDKIQIRDVFLYRGKWMAYWTRQQMSNPFWVRLFIHILNHRNLKTILLQ